MRLGKEKDGIQQRVDHLQKGVLEMGFPVGLLIKRVFLKGGSRALPI